MFDRIKSLAGPLAELYEARLRRLKDLRYSLMTTPLRAVANHYTKDFTGIQTSEDVAVNFRTLPLIITYILITALGLVISGYAVICFGYGLATFISLNHGGDQRIGGLREEVVFWSAVVGLCDTIIVILLSVVYEKEFSLFQRLMIGLGSTLLSILCVLFIAIVSMSLFYMGKSTYESLYWGTASANLDSPVTEYDSDIPDMLAEPFG